MGMMLDKLNILRDILIERLKYIKRWESVGIFFHNDRFPKDTINDFGQINGFYILWYNSKRKDSPNKFEYKTCPLIIEDIDAVIKRQRDKLKKESENA